MTARSVIGIRVRGRTAVVTGHEALTVLGYANVKHRRDKGARGWMIPVASVGDVEAAAQVLGVLVSHARTL